MLKGFSKFDIHYTCNIFLKTYITFFQEVESEDEPDEIKPKMDPVSVKILQHSYSNHNRRERLLCTIHTTMYNIFIISFSFRVPPR